MVILIAESCPRLVRGYYVAIAWLVPVSYKGGPRLPPNMAVFARLGLWLSPALMSIAYLNVPQRPAEMFLCDNVNALSSQPAGAISYSSLPTCGPASSHSCRGATKARGRILLNHWYQTWRFLMAAPEGLVNDGELEAYQPLGSAVGADGKPGRLRARG